jgi:DNA-binding NarL/FixJ family response regulator
VVPVGGWQVGPFPICAYRPESVAGNAWAMSGARWKVLVVDDEPDLRELIRLTLEFDDRLEVVGLAPDIATALSNADADIDLVVLDHWLGGPLTGLDAASRLRQSAPDARIVLFTATDAVEDRNHDVDAVVMKTDLVDLTQVALDLLDP